MKITGKGLISIFRVDKSSLKNAGGQTVLLNTKFPNKLPDRSVLRRQIKPGGKCQIWKIQLESFFFGDFQTLWCGVSTRGLEGKWMMMLMHFYEQMQRANSSLIRLTSKSNFQKWKPWCCLFLLQTLSIALRKSKKVFLQ